MGTPSIPWGVKIFSRVADTSLLPSNTQRKAGFRMTSELFAQQHTALMTNAAVRKAATLTG